MFNLSYQNKKVQLTGHTGFKGSWLAAWLQLLGATVVGIALEANTKPSHFVELKLPIESHLIDIRNTEKVKKIINTVKPEIIFHLAAQPLVRESYISPVYTFETNVLGTANVLNACRDLNSLKAVVVITSDKCYENKDIDISYRENDPMGGFDPYSASKGCAELLTASFRNSFFNLEAFGKTHQTLLASARSGNVIGGGDWAKDRLITDIIFAITRNETVLLRHPQATRPWQHVLECLSGYLSLGSKLLSGEKQFAEAWNFAPSYKEQFTVIDIVKQMQLFWPKLKYEIKPSEKSWHEAHQLKLDSSKAKHKLKWQNVWSFQETIDVTTNWYRQFYEKNSLTTMHDIEKYCHAAKKHKLEWIKK